MTMVYWKQITNEYTGVTSCSRSYTHRGPSRIFTLAKSQSVTMKFKPITDEVTAIRFPLFRSANGLPSSRLMDIFSPVFKEGGRRKKGGTERRIKVKGWQTFSTGYPPAKIGPLKTPFLRPRLNMPSERLFSERDRWERLKWEIGELASYDYPKSRILFASIRASDAPIFLKIKCKLRTKLIDCHKRI